MGFMNGRMTFARYLVTGESPLPFGQEHLDRIAEHAIGRHGTGETQDGVSFGFSGGEHVLATTFDLAKNVIEDALHVSIRTDTDKIPNSLLRAYTEIELKALSADNPTGHPTKAQRAEAKERAQARAEAEASDGRFRKLRHDPILWDGRENILYVGSTSSAVLERTQVLFRETFGREIEPITPGRIAEGNGYSTETGLSLVGGGNGEEFAAIAWAENLPSSNDVLGNEFLVWLWHTLQADGDTLTLSDGSDVSVMLAKTLTLDCPRGETGRDHLTDAGPTRLPEALRALQSGKLPRKAGLIVSRHGMQYDLTLQAESFAVSGANPPKAEGVSGYEAKIARVETLRHMCETLDLLFQSFLSRRFSAEWDSEIGRIRRWLEVAA